ncbi:MAG: EamA family transporter [Treponema sp.]|nr:EamA family transporter [Spirochaetales bacterium]MDY4901392.1 EamA family transporter [Treponema sp.]
MKNQVSKKSAFIASVALILTAAIWGFSFVVMKDTLNVIGPYWIIAIRFLLAGILVFLFSIPRLKKADKSIFVHGLVLGILFFFAYATQTVGCKFTTPGKNAFLTTLYVVLVPLLGWPLLKVKPRWFIFAAACMSITGIGLLALKSGDGSILSMNKGDVLTLVCGVFFALHIIFGAKYVENEDPFLLTAIQFLVSGMLSLISALLFDEPLTVSVLLDRKVVVSILYLTLFASIYGFTVQNVGLKYVPSALASLFMGLESVFGVIFSVIFFGELLTLRMWIGCALIFGAIIMAEVLPNIFKK